LKSRPELNANTLAYFGAPPVTEKKKFSKHRLQENTDSEDCRLPTSANSAVAIAAGFQTNIFSVGLVCFVVARKLFGG
jgi:hypothetical protein